MVAVGPAAGAATIVLHRKSWWLVVVSLGFLLLTGLAYPRFVPVFLAGAIGALIAIILRFTESGKAPTSYKAYWTVIMLGPPAGALAAAAVVVTIAALRELRLLGGAFTRFVDYLGFGAGRTDSLPAGDVVVLAIAFVAGFSARLLEHFAKQLETGVSTPPPGAVSTDRSMRPTGRAPSRHPPRPSRHSPPRPSREREPTAHRRPSIYVLRFPST